MTQEIEKLLEDMQLGMECEFIPLSRSEKPDELKLNWKITLTRNGKPFLVTPYSAGTAHCPSYALTMKDKYIKNKMIAFECEKGKKARLLWGETIGAAESKPILPEKAGVYYCIISDADVLNYPTFEEWAPNLGYDPDSRSGERIYSECLKQALALRAAIGEDGMRKLQEAFQDY